MAADLELSDAASSGRDDINDGCECGNKVVSSSPATEDAASSGEVDITDGGICLNKVVPSSPATEDAARPGEVDMNEGSICPNKVAPSSPATEEWHGDTMDVSDSTHAKVKCMRRYRIKVKGAACRGSACCGETT